MVEVGVSNGVVFGVWLVVKGVNEVLLGYGIFKRCVINVVNGCDVSDFIIVF